MSGWVDLHEFTTSGYDVLVANQMTLKEFVVPWGMQARLAEQVGVKASLISMWANQARAVPEEHAPAIEWFTDFAVPVETLCPDTRWIRVKDPGWPNGRPLIDHSPLIQPHATPPDLRKLVPAG